MKKQSSYAQGARSRKQAPRGALAAWQPTLREHSVQHLLVQGSQGRLPALARIKQARMTASAFGFFRGAAGVMAYDLSLAATTGIEARLCGDAHVANVGAGTGADGRLIFDINDFDESLPGPFEWDVKRMATSLLLAGAGARLKPSDSRFAVELCLNSYAHLIVQLARMPLLEAARYQVHRLRAVASISQALAKAERMTPQASLKKLMEEGRHGWRFRDEPPLLRPVKGAEARAVLAALPGYAETLEPERRALFARFTPRAVAFKVVGTGSVGLRDFCVYLEGEPPLRCTQPDALFLQVKQEVASCLAPYVRAPAHGHQGRRAVEGQRAMQQQSDPMLGWTTIAGRDYLVRQLNDHKASVDLTRLKAPDLAQYASVCGELLARGHARSGNAQQIAGYLGNGARFRAAIAGFAESYAQQTTEDWKAFAKKQGAGKG